MNHQIAKSQRDCNHTFSGADDTDVQPEPKEFIIANASTGMKALLTDYGARLMALYVPNRDGTPVDVALGLGDAKQYENDESCMGAIIGRNANRIKDAQYSIGSHRYVLDANENRNSNHSGPNGYERRIWDCTKADGRSLTFSLFSHDMDQCHPGNFRIKACYTLMDNNELRLDIEGVADKATIANLTTHIYWNLEGEGQGTIDNHLLHIPATGYLPTDAQFVPLAGGARPVAGTPMDFRSPIAIEKAQKRETRNEQLRIGHGYNHTFVFEQAADKGQRKTRKSNQTAETDTGAEKRNIRPAATEYVREGSHDIPAQRLLAQVRAPQSGIGMNVYANSPCILLYTAGFLPPMLGRDGHHYQAASGLCLEPGFAPNAINDTTQISPILQAQEHYRLNVRYQFFDE
ncbi:aldose epimerase family protein [Bifidobacterium sp. ESL0800]|uniref:aldose epimerase family protein n=1 Tax=Bifidobacterium sp. ESL0800 TaxID=2983236 RepID=UPI0023F78703|nr:aldose epimerase family protein [Bifidobacterium sp. ESL0800]WEV75858.1 galactose mutarotase [Bifidobacterium sp. ESL0800]